MPSQSTRASIFNRRSLGLLAILPGLYASAPLAEAPIPYGVTEVGRFSEGRMHGRDVYEGKERGDRDRESLLEVYPADALKERPPVQVVDPSAPPPVHQVVVLPESRTELAGEDRVFDQIRLDVDIQRCVFQNNCTDEVKAIPGIYLGGEQGGDDDWTGRSEGPLEVITENNGPRTPDVPGSIAPFEPRERAPGRVFVEEPTGTP